jgi:hypothetical protein
MCPKIISAERYAVSVNPISVIAVRYKVTLKLVNFEIAFTNC